MLDYADFQNPAAEVLRKFHRSAKDHSIMECVGAVGRTGLRTGKYKLRYGHEWKIDIGKKRIDIVFTQRFFWKMQ
jgi:hypothetical protein